MEANFKLKAGDILHCSRDSFVGRMIMATTKSDYSHTALVIDIWGDLYIIDSQRRGTFPRPLEQWLKDFEYDIVVARKRISRTKQKFISKRAMSKSGMLYDFDTLLFRHPWNMLTGKWLDDEFSEDKMVCSEFVIWCWDVESSSRYTPQMAFDWTQKNNFIHKKYEYTLQN